MYDVHDDVWDSEVVAVSSLLLQGSNPSDDIVNGSSKRWGVVEPGRLPHIMDRDGAPMVSALEARGAVRACCNLD